MCRTPSSVIARRKEARQAFQPTAGSRTRDHGTRMSMVPLRLLQRSLSLTRSIIIPNLAIQPAPDALDYSVSQSLLIAIASSSSTNRPYSCMAAVTGAGVVRSTPAFWSSVNG